MAYLGTIVFLVAALGAFLLWRGRLERTRWYLWAAVFTIPLPYLAALAGWVLTEVGRQPWIVQGLLRTADAASPSVSAWWVGLSLGVFITLYIALGVTDFILMRRYARLDPAPPAPIDRAVPVPGLEARWDDEPPRSLVRPDRRSSGAATSCSRASTSVWECCCPSLAATRMSAGSCWRPSAGVGRQ